MLRILAGEKKGHNLHVPRTRAVRPTAANARQILFDILAGTVEGTRWLDLFAGSGAVGLEALSRGAADCVFVESTHACLTTLRENVALLHYEERARVISVPVEKALKWLINEGRTFDVIFLDPPYHHDEAMRTLLALGGPAIGLLTAPESLVVAQVTTHLAVRPRYGELLLERQRKTGDTNLCFFRREAQPDEEKKTSPV